MAKMNSKFKYMYDAASTASLRAKSAGAITSDNTGDALLLDQLDGYWNTEGELADQTLAVVINVESVLSAAHSYKIDLQAGPVGFGSNAIVGTIAAVTGPGQYVILLDIDTVKKIKNDAAALRLVTDVTGATPSIDFYAWISGIQV